MNKVKEIIINYCKSDNRNPYALMIDGKWGSGKTYYIKKIIKQDIEKASSKKLLYISLNGVSSFSEIYDQLVSEKFKLVRFFEENKVARISAKIFKSATNILLNAARIKNDTENFGNFNPTYKDTPNFTAQEISDFSKNIIVFDDIERLSSKLSIIDILGFINTNFIEHDEIKVIIIGDSSEIKKDKRKFKKQKEKVIGRIIQFTPTIEEVLDDYLSKMSSGFTSYRKFIDSKKSFLLKRIDQAKITNLRTFFFFLDSFQQIFNKLEDNEIKYLGEKILLFTLVCSNEFKLGCLDKMSIATLNEPHDYSFNLNASSDNSHAKGDDSKKEKFENYEKQFREKYYKNSGYFLLFYRPIFDFIETGILNETLLKAEIKKKMPSNITAEIESFNLIRVSNIENLTDKEYIKNTKIVLEGVEKGLYDLHYFVSVIDNIEAILHWGFSVEGLKREGADEDYWTKHFNTLVNRKEHPKLNHKLRIRSNEPIFKNYHELSKKIENFEKKLIDMQNEAYSKELLEEFILDPAAMIPNNNERSISEIFPRFVSRHRESLTDFLFDTLFKDSRIIKPVILAFGKAYDARYNG